VIGTFDQYAISGNRNTAENQNAERQARLQPRPIGWPKERIKNYFRGSTVNVEEPKRFEPH
jgi:hypothetical protein